MNRQSTKITALYCRIANPVQNTDELPQQAQMDILSQYAISDRTLHQERGRR